MRNTKLLPGNKYLCDNMDMVRDIAFTKVEVINLGKMTKDF